MQLVHQWELGLLIKGEVTRIMVFRYMYPASRIRVHISMLYNSFRVLNYTHRHEVLFKQRVKKSKKKKGGRKQRWFYKTSLLILPQMPSFSFFPLQLIIWFPSSLFHNQEEDSKVKTNEFLA